MPEDKKAKEVVVRERKKLEFGINETALMNTVRMRTNPPPPTKFQRIMRALEEGDSILKR